MLKLDSYIIEAEKVLINLLYEWRPRLVENHGLPNYNLKADRSVVTELDVALETAIKDVLRPISTEVGFVGEEHGQEGSKEVFWFVDPIDGTEQFIRGLDGCRTLLCLIAGGEPVYAFAYRFTTDDLFTAQKGKGAKRNGESISIRPRELSRAWVEMAMDLQNPEIVAQMVRVNAVVNATVYTKEFLNILDGYVDAYVVSGGKGKEWDYAPRALLMREAGAKISNIGSNTYDYRNLSLIAAHPDIFDKLYNLLSPQA